MIKAVIFDYGGVIGNDPSRYIFRAVTKEFGIDIETIKSEFLNFIFLLEENKISEEKFWREFAQNLHIADHKKLKKIWLGAFRKHAHIDKQMLHFIKRLKRYYKLCVLSNRAIFYQKPSIIRSLEETFPVIINSCDVKMRKPGKQIYLYAIKKLKVQPNECLVVDDNESYIIYLKKIGIEAVHFKSTRKFKKELKAKLISI